MRSAVAELAAQFLAGHRRLVQRDLERERVLEAPLDRRPGGVDGRLGGLGRRVAIDLGQHQPAIDQPLQRGADRIRADVRGNEAELQRRPHVGQRDDLRVDHRENAVDDLRARRAADALTRTRQRRRASRSGALLIRMPGRC